MQYFFAILMLASLGACHSSKPAAEEPAQDCPTPGVVRDMSQLDGCRFLIELANGVRLLPADGIPDDFPLTDGMAIKFDYEVLEGQMSICMAESAIVRITCIQASGERPEIPTCHDTTDPGSVEWMQAALEKHAPYEVVKYPYLDGWAYFFRGGPVSYLYDCQGNFLCEAPGKMLNDCVRKVQGLGEGEVIWRRGG
ncbi:MAG: hypothetical protein KDC30_12235 [Saprospiraceae bacterium]|nr:hypothetical protein [Saprospiraceae bacterium]